MLQSTLPSKRIFYGWYIVAAGAVLATISGTGYYGFGVFFNPIREEFGWTAAVVAGAFSIQRLEGGIAAPLVGWGIDRFGPRPVGMLGAFAAGIGFIFMSRIHSLWAFYVTFVIASLSTNMAGAPVVNASITKWFVRRRGRALAITHTGFGLAGFAAPVLTLLIAHYSWRQALILTGLTWWVICIPVSLALRHMPEKYGFLPDGDSPNKDVSTTSPSARKAKAQIQEGNFTAKQAIRSSSFWLLTGSSLFTSMGMGSVFALMIPALESYGIPRATAAFGVSFLTLFTLVGRWGFGLAADVATKPRYLLVMTAVLKLAGLLVFANIHSAWMIIPFAVFFSLGFGGDVTARSVLLGRYFGRNAFGTIQGLMATATVIGGVMAPVFAGWVFDTYGSYRPAFLVMSIFIALAIPMLIAAKSPAEMQKKPQPAKVSVS